MGLFMSAAGHAQETVPLPPPATQGVLTVEAAIQKRRTLRRFANRPLTLSQVGQLLWAANGITEPRRRLRAIPSAGALYPLEVYVVAGERLVQDLPAGVYRYLPEGHALKLVAPGDQRPALARASLQQSWMATAPLILVVAGEYARSTRKYGDRGVIYTHMESGHAGQNIFLQAAALDLGAGIVGAFENNRVTQALGLPAAHEPLLVMPVGYPD